MRRGQLFFLFLVIAAGVSVWAFHQDMSLRSWIVERQGGLLWKGSEEARIYGAVRSYGDWPWLMLCGVVGLGVSWFRRNPKWTRIFVAAMVASSLAGVLANVSRLTTGRTRPRVDYHNIPPGFYGPFHSGQCLIGEPDFNSFPSGHTATAVGFAVPVLLAAPVAGIVVMSGAVAIAWASIYIGAHHFSDVTVSFFLACLVGYVTWRVVVVRGFPSFEKWKRK